MKKFLFLFAGLLISLQAKAMNQSDPVIANFFLDEFEKRFHDGENALGWKAKLSVGNDDHQAVLVSEGEYADSEIVSHELRGYYSRPVTPYWNALLGWRGDLEADYDQHWLMLAIEGEAPFFIETTAYIFTRDDRSAFRLELEKALMLTQRWVLLPELKINSHTYNDRHQGIGSGLSTVEASIRLGLELSPQFMPYLGLSWEKSFGKTADFLALQGDDSQSNQLLIGIKFWL